MRTAARTLGIVALIGVAAACGGSASGDGSAVRTDSVSVSTSSASGPVGQPGINGGVGSPGIGGGVGSPGIGGSVGGPGISGSIGGPGIGAASTGNSSGSTGGAGGDCSSVENTALSFGDPADCAQCIAGSCCSEATACLNDTQCTAYLQCEQNCSTQAECDQCTTQYPSATSLFQPVADCVSSSCSSTCITVTVSGGTGDDGGCTLGQPGDSCNTNGDCCDGLCTTVTAGSTTESICE